MKSRWIGLASVVLIGMSVTACADEVASEDINTNELGLVEPSSAEVETDPAATAEADTGSEGLQAAGFGRGATTTRGFGRGTNTLGFGRGGD